jgi:hypothetical protein
MVRIRPHRAAHAVRVASPRNYHTTVLVLAGALRMEFGPGGTRVVDAGPGDFVFVPKEVVHRESNPGDTHSEVIVVRAGRVHPLLTSTAPRSDGFGAFRGEDRTAYLSTRQGQHWLLGEKEWCQIRMSPPSLWPILIQAFSRAEAADGVRHDREAERAGSLIGRVRYAQDRT